MAKGSILCGMLPTFFETWRPKMKYAIVRPAVRDVLAINVKDMESAKRCAGLDTAGVDFGIVYQSQGIGLGIVVYEFGLLRHDPRTGKRTRSLPMFGLSGQLYAGNAVLYSFDGAGKTIDLHIPIGGIERACIWLANPNEVEQAIQSGLVRRPIRAINDEVLGAWPNL
jgi:hypothetical protein